MILECDGEFVPEAEAHCRECASCRTLMEDWRRLRELRLPECSVPETLDETILDAALRNTRKSRYRLLLQRAAVFAAAAGIIVGSVVLYLFPDGLSQKPPPQPELVAEWDWEAFEKWLFDSDNSLLTGQELTALEGNGGYSSDFYFTYDFLFQGNSP